MTSPSGPHTLFISDLHLCAERPRINEIFFRFTGEIASKAQALYILGDLFEYWVGDDDTADMLAADVAQSLLSLSRQGVAVYLMQGNRDVLLGSGYAQRCGATLIPDPTVIDLYGVRTLLMHGDTLCTDDLEYQKFRTYIRDPRTQAQLLAQPLSARHEKARAARIQSDAHKSTQSEEIMDVNNGAVVAAFQRHGVTQMIHGHTHRPARHVLSLEQSEVIRWVLPDWSSKCGYLISDSTITLRAEDAIFH